MAEEAAGDAKKGGKKKQIMMIVAFALIGLIAAKMTVLKPPPVTPKQKADKDAIAHWQLQTMCALANDMQPPSPPKVDMPVPTTTTTVPGTDNTPVGPVLDLDSKTLNLSGGHFLKIGLAVQLPVKSVPDDVGKTENWGALTGQIVLNKFAGASMDDILPKKEREQIRHEIGNEVCVESEGKATTVYFTEFVAQ